MKRYCIIICLSSVLLAFQHNKKPGHGHGGGGLSQPLACSDLETSTPITGPISMSATDWCVLGGPSAVNPTPTANGWMFSFPIYTATTPFALARVVSPVATSFTQSQSLSISFILTTNNAVFQDVSDATACTNAPTADMTLYFEHSHNTQDVLDWRWWSGPELYTISNSSSPLTETVTATVTVPLQPINWSDTNGTNGANDPTGFADTLANVGTVGIEIGSGCFFGHGTELISGAASIEVQNFSVQ